MPFSPRVIQFCAYWGARRHSSTPEITPADIYAPPTATSAVKNALDVAFPDLGVLSPPIDLRLLASRRKVRAISLDDLVGDGEIKRSPDGYYTISVNKSHSETRQRFTIAHELAHTLFFEAFGEPTLLESRYFCGMSRDPEEELLCDYAAAEILLPYRQVKTLVDKLGVNAASIVGLSQKFRSSLRATSRKLVAMSPLKSVVCYWEKEKRSGHFVCMWRECSDARQQGWNDKIFLSPEDPAFKTFDSREHFRGRYWLKFGGPLDRYFVDAFVLSSSRPRILTVISLDGAAEVFYRNSVRTSDLRQGSLF